MGFPPSSLGAFHFNVTELLSYLAISRSFGSEGGSSKQAEEERISNRTKEKLRLQCPTRKK